MARKPYDTYMQAAEYADLLPDPAQEQPEDAAASVPENLEELCRLHVCPGCTVQAQAEDVRLRALAETENTKKRLQREQEERLRFAAERILLDVLPTLDTLDLALQYGAGQEECRNVVQGVEMTKKLLLDALRGHGLEVVGERGELFTPERHEAMGFEGAGDLADGHVCSVLQRGYLLKERLLRPAKVMVVKN